MMHTPDLAHCKEAIRHGSLSFHAASRLLPARVRDPALALYAFCRIADDAVDLNDEKPKAVLRLRDRLDQIYEGRPRNTPVDRAFAAVVEDLRDAPRASRCAARRPGLGRDGPALRVALRPARLFLRAWPRPSAR